MTRRVYSGEKKQDPAPESIPGKARRTTKVVKLQFRDYIRLCEFRDRHARGLSTEDGKRTRVSLSRAVRRLLDIAESRPSE